jgi:hypothetical protein
MERVYVFEPDVPRDSKNSKESAFLSVLEGETEVVYAGNMVYAASPDYDGGDLMTCTDSIELELVEPREVPRAVDRAANGNLGYDEDAVMDIVMPYWEELNQENLQDIRKTEKMLEEFPLDDIEYDEARRPVQNAIDDLERQKQEIEDERPEFKPGMLVNLFEIPRDGYAATSHLDNQKLGHIGSLAKYGLVDSKGISYSDTYGESFFTLEMTEEDEERLLQVLEETESNQET